MQSVDDIARSTVGCEPDFLKLNELDEDNSFVLFKRHAFAGMALEGCAEFLLTREQIVKKKKRGCPLLAKVVGAFERQEDTWILEPVLLRGHAAFHGKYR